MDKVKQFEINRRVVQDGLKRRAEEREAAERETALEFYEADMIRFCNDRHEVALVQRKTDDDVRKCFGQCKHNIAGRAKAKAQKQRVQKDTALSSLSYFAYTVLMFWLTTWTYLPVWGAAAAVLGFLPVLLAHIYLLHNPLSERKEAAHGCK